MISALELKKIAPEIIKKYSHKSNAKGLWQNINTLVPYFALFYLAMDSLATESYGFLAGYLFLLSLFIVRIFMLMHDCGHKSLFKTQLFNTIGGFFTGVFVGMPQYVWAQHHNYHHSTNGNWEKYRGPLNILTVEEFSKLSARKQKKYLLGRNILLAPFGAFLYFIFNPRINWIVGSIQFAINIIKKKVKTPKKSFKNIFADQESRFWKTRKEYIHMTLNNVVLLSIWLVASSYFGVITFFTIYIISLSLAGAAGLIIFTLQHNFEDSYASNTEHWNYYLGALKGTSFFTVPKFFNWFGADIAYHHIHHLSANIPNYNLASCHKEYAYLFDDVKRIRLRDALKEFKFILWDEEKQTIISIQQYNQAYT